MGMSPPRKVAATTQTSLSAPTSRAHRARPVPCSECLAGAMLTRDREGNP